jgi:uncharacterized protein (DUF2141 family)
MKHLFGLKTTLLITIFSLITNNLIFGAVFTVTSTNQGPGVVGSILDAINSANAMPDRDSIIFAVAGPINMSTTINITNPVAIDGYTSASPACGAGIRTQLLYSGNAGTAIKVSGTTTVTIRGLVITGVGIGVGINLLNSTACRVEGNYIGISPNGLALSDVAVRGNNQGIWIQNANIAGNHTIGGPTCRERNVISNYVSCIEIVSSFSNTITNNYLGTDYLGKTALADATYGFPTYSSPDYNSYGIHNISGSNNTLITKNVIGGRRKYGIYFDKTVANTNPGNNAILKGNFVGIGADSVSKLGNGWTGIFFHMSQKTTIGGPLASEINYSGNNGFSPFGNWETTGHGGGMQLANGAGASVIQNNVTGLSPNGKTPMPNAQDGISLLGSSGNTIKNNVSAWNVFGIFLQGQLNYGNNPPDFNGGAICSNNRVTGNIVKYNGYNANNPSEGGGIGLQFTASNNLIGLDSIGLGNTVDSNVTGIVLRNDNINSGFANLSIYGAPSNKIYNNTITRSTASNGPKYTAMNGAGLVIHGDGSDNNIIGGSGPNQANTIINNGFTGVYIETSVKNYVYPQNKIYCNGGTTGAQAIKLAAKPASAGVIGNNNYGSTSPVAGHVTVNAFNTSSADASDSTGAVSYIYKGYAPANSRLYIYMADNCATCSKGSGFFKQGITLKDSLTLPGNGIWSYTLPKPVGNGIVVYAVEPSGVNRNVSEFSQCFSPLCSPPSSSVISPASPAAACTGSSIALKASGGKPTYIYTWFNGATAQNGPAGKANDSTFNATTSGSYTVRIADPSNPGNTSCYKTSAPVTITIDASTLPGSIGSSQSVCSGQTPQPFTSNVSATGGNGSITYQWQVSTNNVTFTDIAANGTSATYAAPAGISVPTYYRRNSTAGACPASSSNTIKVSIDQAAVGGVIKTNSGASVCQTSNSGVLTLTGYSSKVKGWLTSTDNFVTSSQDTITTPTHTFSSLSQTTQFKAIVSSGACPDANSAPITIKVDSTTTGGTIANSSSVACMNNNTGTLTLSAYKTKVKNWYYSTDNFATTNNLIAGATNPTYTYTNLSKTTQFQVVVSSGSCADAKSAIFQVLVDTLSDGGKISSTALNICPNTPNNGTVKLSKYKYAVKEWQSSKDNFATAPVSITNTTDTLGFSNLKGTTYFRALVYSGSCPSVPSPIITIKADSAATKGSISSNAGPSVCTGTNSGTLTLSKYSKTIKRWEFSTDNFITASVVAPNDTTASLTFKNLIKNTQYRAVVSSGTCPDSASAFFNVVVDPLANKGTLSTTNANVCQSSNTGTITLNNYSKTIKRWESSTDNFITATNLNNTSPSYTFTNLTASTKYRVVVSSGACSDSVSLPLQINVDPTPVKGTLASSVNSSICSGSNSGTITLTGYTKSIQGWESSTDNFITKSTISDTSASIKFTNIAKTTYFHAIVVSGTCNSVNSPNVTVVVDPASIGGTAFADSSNFCVKGATTVKLKDQTGATYQWQSSPDNSSFIDIPGATSATYATPLLLKTTYYRAQVSNKSCGKSPSGQATITISTGSIAGTISGPKDLCALNSTTLTLTGSTGSIQWESADSLLKYQPIALNGTDNPYTSPLLTKNTYYHAVVTNGACPAVKTTNYLVLVKPVPDFSAGIDTIVCEGNQFVAKATPGFKNYHWDNGPDSNAIVITTPGLYTVHALAQNDCPVSATLKVDKCNDVIFHNVITPGVTPGINDKFIIQGNVKGSSLDIYNRWGTVMFTSTDYDNNWEGTNASDGTYYYIYRQPNGNSYSGYLEIVR